MEQSRWLRPGDFPAEAPGEFSKALRVPYFTPARGGVFLPLLWDVRSKTENTDSKTIGVKVCRAILHPHRGRVSTRASCPFLKPVHQI